MFSARMTKCLFCDVLFDTKPEINEKPVCETQPSSVLYSFLLACSLSFLPFFLPSFLHLCLRFLIEIVVNLIS